MADRVLIFNRSGQMLAEIAASVTRSWQLERSLRADRAQFSMSMSDAKCTEGNLRYMNRVVVQSDTLPDWGGIIWTPREWRPGIVTVNMLSAEYLLAFRRTGTNDTLSGTIGSIFQDLIEIANGSEDMGIQVDADDLDFSSKSGVITFNLANIFEAINTAAADYQFYWWLEPVLSDTNRLTFTANIAKNRGRRFRGGELIEGGNFNDVKVSETGELANRIYTWGKFDSWTNPLVSVAEDEASRADYGLIEDAVGFPDVENVGYLDAAADALVTRQKKPRYKVPGTISRSPYPFIGDLVDVRLVTALWTDGLVGKKVSNMRVKAMQYTPDNGGILNVSLDNIYWE